MLFFFKLPPVGNKSSFCFEKLSVPEIKNVFNGIPLIYNFWDEFSYVELTESMRQRDEQDFFQFLNRMRIALPTQEDIDILQSIRLQVSNAENKIKEAAEFYKKLLNDHKSIIALFSKNIDVDNFNRHMSLLNEVSTQNVYAEDTEEVLSKKISNER